MEYNFEISDTYINDNSVRIEVIGTLKQEDLEGIKKVIYSKNVYSLNFDFKQTIQTWKIINKIIAENPKLLIVLNYCNYELKDLLFLKHLTNVEYLRIDYFWGTDISPIAYLKKLKHLIFRCSFSSVKVRLKPLTNLKELRYLEIYNIKDIEEIANFKNLTRISLHNLKTDNLNFMSALENLEEIALYGSHKILDYTGLYKLQKLKKAFINWNYKNITAEFLSHLVYLEDLTLLNFSVLRKFPSLEKLTKLKRLSVTQCKLLSDIGGIVKAPNLEEVSLYLDKEFKPSALNVLRGHKKLRKIETYFSNNKDNIEAQLIIEEILK